MSAMAPKTPGATFDETIDFGHDPDAGRDRPKPAAGPHRYAYSSGARPLDGYTIKRAIGRGGFGEVYYATSDSGKEVALKLITRNVEVERRGVALCMNLKCPNLLAIHDIRSNDADETFVVMEYVAGPSLASVLAKYPDGMPESEVRAWLKGLLDGVDYLHDHGIVHRDLKPANLFMEEGIVKIGDYGLSKIISPQIGSEHSESIGTCHYMAPEISNGKYGKPIDVYAIGVILYEMLTGRVPFEGETVGEVLMKHLTARPDLNKLREPWRSIVAKAMSKVPGDRQVRAIDMLPADAAPKARDVRFIGEGRVAPPTEPRGHAELKDVGGKVRAKHDDVLRISDEEPPFYIGPNTRTPVNPAGARRFGAMTPPIRWLGDVVRSRPKYAPRAATAPPAPRRWAVWGDPRKARPVAPPPAPEPVPLPSARLRTAELTGSMITVAILTALLCIPISLNPTVDFEGRPQNLAFLYLVSLVGSWGVLTVNKVLEGRRIDPISKRLTYLTLGLGVGAFALATGSWLFPTLTDAGPMVAFNFEGVGVRMSKLGLSPVASFLSYFGIAYFANGWWKLTDRDRPSRFSLWSVVKAGAVGLLASPLWPYQEFWSAATIGMTAVVLQFASPWSEPAAKYAAYARKLSAKGTRAA